MAIDEVKNNYDDIVIHPIKTKKEKSIPSSGLMLVNPADAQYGIDIFKQQGAENRRFHNSTLYVNQANDFFISGPAIGAPAAVMAMEKLIALGARRIFFYGWCGAIERNLSVCDIVIPTQAMSGETTPFASSGTCHPKTHQSRTPVNFP